jgi:hypothetical protein
MWISGESQSTPLRFSRIDEQATSDTRHFTFTRWEDAALATKRSLSSSGISPTGHPSPNQPANRAVSDLEKITETADWQTLQMDLRKQSVDPEVLPAIRRLLGHLAPFPRTLATFVGKFTQIINPYEGDFTIIWGLVDLNIKVFNVWYPVVQSLLIKA